MPPGLVKNGFDYFYKLITSHLESPGKIRRIYLPKQEFFSERLQGIAQGLAVTPLILSLKLLLTKVEVMIREDTINFYCAF